MHHLLLTLLASNAKWEAIARMTEMRDGGILAFIGPDETCTHEALAASAWNLPMIAFVSCNIYL